MGKKKTKKKPLLKYTACYGAGQAPHSQNTQEDDKQETHEVWRVTSVKPCLTSAEADISIWQEHIQNTHTYTQNWFKY